MTNKEHQWAQWVTLVCNIIVTVLSIFAAVKCSGDANRIRKQAEEMRRIESRLEPR